MRGSGLTMIGFGGQNVLRLISNLILTRLLFPEAFGLMALVQVFLAGLMMFSDIGIKTSIIQNKRGDDPDFLNTAWTIQIIRGVLLWLAACALAIPAANLYDEPMLAQLLPIVGLNALIAGFTTTNIATADRHLRIGRQTMVTLGCQAFGIVVMVILAIILQSVWALVIGNLISGIASVFLLHWLLPGIRNRLRWDPSAARDLVNFGKYIFLSTMSGFLINQGDRAILGGFITLAELGVYNIGFFLGTVPVIMARALNAKVIQSLYRMKPPAESAANRRHILKSRRMVVGAMLILTVPLAYGGIFLTDLMYDPRYALSGPMVVMFSLAIVPQIVFNGYGSALLASGDSKRHFILLVTTALLQTLLMFLGVQWFGIIGAILAPALANLATYPLRSRFVALYAADDKKADAIFLALGFAINGFACWLHWEAIAQLLP